MKIVSQRQAAFLGAIAGSGAKPATGPSPAKARLMLRENRGMKMAALPERAPARVRSRVSRRGGR